MGQRKRWQAGPQRHAEGQHGEKTHQRFLEQLQEGMSAAPQTDAAPLEGNRRLHRDREPHDPAEKNSERVEALRDEQRGHIDENVSRYAD